MRCAVSRLGPRLHVSPRPQDPRRGAGTSPWALASGSSRATSTRIPSGTAGRARWGCRDRPRSEWPVRPSRRRAARTPRCSTGRLTSRCARLPPSAVDARRRARPTRSIGPLSTAPESDKQAKAP